MENKPVIFVHNNGDWIPTNSGMMINIFDPHPEDIDLDDIAVGLGRIKRYSGQSNLSVAEHSLLIASKMPTDELKLAALFHDATEFLFWDVPRPVKRAMGGTYREMEANLMQVICNKFGVMYPEPPIVKECDTSILIDEFKYLFKNPAKNAGVKHFEALGYKELGVVIHCYSPQEATRLWLNQVSQTMWVLGLLNPLA